MRRKDREITDMKKIEEIISACHCCRLGFNDGGEVYIVPLNFGFESADGIQTFYFHGAKEGRKMDLIRSSPRVCFELDTDYRLRTGELAGDCTAHFQSVIGNGTVELVEDEGEVRRGLLSIMEHNTGRRDWNFDENLLRAVQVFKLTVEKLSCKEHE